ncbi:MAG: ATP-binding protein [Candidatus Limnocylindria bacterium]
MSLTRMLLPLLTMAGVTAPVAPAPGRPAPREWQAGFSRRADVEFRLLLEKLPAAAYTCDQAGLITFFNNRAVELWGREPLLNDPRDRFCGSFRLFGADGAPISHDACWMALALRDDRSYDGHEIVIERPDCSRRTVLAHASPIHGPRGRVTGAVNVLVDITDRKLAETRLQQADRAKDEFLAMLAHELRGPLAPMHNALQLMRLSTATSPADGARETLGRQLQHLTRVVDDLLDLSRITRNTLELRRERVALGPIIDQAVDTCRPMADCADHAIEVAQPSRPIHLDADPVRLTQVLANLLANACRYTDAGGRIRIEVVRSQREAVVSVRDNGAGIAAESLDTIFDLFARAASGQRGDDGLGIGLTLARRITELHGGSIEARSDGPGTGSEFRVRLPVTDAAKARRPIPAPATVSTMPAPRSRSPAACARMPSCWISACRR